MKHKRATKTLGRETHKRRSLLRGLARDLITHGSLTTTRGKATSLVRFIEPILTRARGEFTLPTRRRLLQQLGRNVDLERLQAVAALHTKRPGGYTRLTKVPSSRHDGAAMVQVDIIDADKA